MNEKQSSSSSRELLIHVHPNKTGGTSLRRAICLTHQPEHLRAIHLRRHYPESWDSALKFCFVRNPYDRVVSMYEYRKRINHRDLATRGTEFGDWVREVFLHRSGPYFNKEKFFQTCLYWIVDDVGSCLVDQVFRFEEFDAAVYRLRILMKTRGIPGSDFELMHEKKNPIERDFREYYRDDHIRQIVRRFFAKDLIEFGYTFNADGSREVYL